MSDRRLPFEPDPEPDNGNGHYKNNGQTPGDQIIPYSDKETKYIKHASCKVCNAADREEAEMIFEQHHNCARVQRFLEKKGMKISFQAVQRHMQNHYEQGKNIMLMKWYAQDISKWMELSRDPEKAMQVRIAVLERELHILASQSDGLPLCDRRKNAEAIRKLTETLNQSDVQLQELRQEREPIKFIFQQLKVVVNDKLKEVDSHEIRGAVVDILTNLQSRVGDLIVQNEG